MIRSTMRMALFLAVVSASTPRVVAGKEFKFNKPVPVRTILETFEAFGQFNIILCEGNENEVTFSIDDVSAKEALRVFVMSQGLKIHPVENTGGRETFLVGTADQIAAITQARGMQVVTLRFQDTNKIEGILQDVLSTNQVKIRSVPAQNMLILEGPSSGLRKAVEILTYLDLPVPTVRFVISVTQGDKEIWQATLESLSGRKVEAVVGSLPGQQPQQQYLTLELNPRVNKDGLIFLDASVRLSGAEAVKDPQSVILERISTAVEMKNESPLDLAQFKRGDGSTLTVKVTAKVGQVAVAPSLDPNEILSSFPKLPEIDIEEDAVAEGASPGASPPAGEIGGDLGGDLGGEDLADSVDITPPTTSASPATIPDPGNVVNPLEDPGNPSEDLGDLDPSFGEDEYPRVLPPDEE